MQQPKAKKSLGQHFLRDKNISEKIVQLLHIAKGDRVIEIGPGPGALTNILEKQPLKELVLVEKDNFYAKERQRCAQEAGSSMVQALLMDAMNMPWEKITPENPWKIISNLPYNVGSPLMWDIFSQSTGLVRAVFMMQKEVGLRLIAQPHNKEYGALSVWAQSFVRPEWGFVVGPKSFSPPPKVDSAVLAFTPLAPELRPQFPDALAKLIKMCFQNRRKQLKSILKQNSALHLLPILEELDIDPMRRPETLSPQDFNTIVLKMQHSA